MTNRELEEKVRALNGALAERDQEITTLRFKAETLDRELSNAIEGAASQAENLAKTEERASVAEEALAELKERFEALEQSEGGERGEPIGVCALLVALSGFVRLPEGWTGYPPELPQQLTDPKTGVTWYASVDNKNRTVRLLRRVNDQTICYELDAKWFGSLRNPMPECAYVDGEWHRV